MAAIAQTKASVIKDRQDMWRLIKLLFVLLVIGGIGLVGYAYIADLTPAQKEVTETIKLGTN
ncbi:hypothetical protein [Tropicimonas sp.]|uniref:hypothetical protein n=1 Tax=Tropicimonas sp. TaxID=2067044 RepID=UPI003A86C59E